MTETDIDATVDRLEEIIDTLEGDEVALPEAKELHEEGTALLEELREALDVGDGAVVEK